MKIEKILTCFLLLLFIYPLSAQKKELVLKLVETSDIHGNFFPYDFVAKKETKGSMSRVSSYLKAKRQTYGENLILIDNGDILQGEASVYYYNFIDTISPHICAEMMNYMGYNIGNIGNHDIEVGRGTFERWKNNCNFPVLGANVIDTSTGEPYLKPYEVIEREGVKIVILGMITPAIPVWLPENLWKGLLFEDMEKTAKKWMRIIQREEKPDVVIGLFHSGQFESLLGKKYKDNASLSVARNVPGFDVIMMGHDHVRECKKIMNISGDTILVVNPASNGQIVAEVDITLKLEDNQVVEKGITGALISIDQFNPDKEFLEKFNPQFKSVENFISKEIGVAKRDITSGPSFFGPSPFVDLIHSLQLSISGADISFTAPFSYNTKIKEGAIKVSDLFTLYRYENMLYVMRLTGKEIKNYLEYSYWMWTNRMKSPKSNLLNLKPEKERNTGFNAFKFFTVNFDSAAGIIYTVDVTKGKGNKISIISMADGTPFDMDKEYTVAVNSYRGNGGGELLTKGAGIPQEKLKERIIYSKERDLRYYLMKYIENQGGELDPQPLNHWKFIPEEWVAPAAKRDYDILFGPKTSK